LLARFAANARNLQCCDVWDNSLSSSLPCCDRPAQGKTYEAAAAKAGSSSSSSSSSSQGRKQQQQQQPRQAAAAAAAAAAAKAAGTCGVLAISHLPLIQVAATSLPSHPLLQALL
jgi:predicted lipid-binding transport protein (Tim44 family)